MHGATHTCRHSAWWSTFVAMFCFMSGGHAAVQAQDTHPITFEDLTDLDKVEVQSMQLAPDGSRLAYTVSSAHPELWLVETRPGSLPRPLGPGQFPHWSPDGTHLAYYARVSGTLQLWVLDLASGHTEAVTHVAGGIDPDPNTGSIGLNGWIGDPLRYAWSPDGTRLVFPSQVVTSRRMSRAAAAVEAATPLVLTTTTPAQWTLAGIFRSGGFEEPRHWVDGKEDQTPNAAPPPATANQLFVVDIRRKVVTQLTHDDAGYFTPDWSPDGRQILCVSNEGRPLLGWGSGPTNLYTIEVATGRKTAVTTDSIYKTIPVWSPDGKSILYSGASADDLGRESLLVIPAGGGTPVNMIAKLDRRLFDAQWLSGSQSIAINYWDGVDAPIARLTVPSGDVDVVSGPESAARGVMTMTVSRVGTIAWAQSDGASPARLYVRPPSQRAAYVLVDLTAPKLTRLQLGKQEVIRWKTRRGDDREGVLVKPVGYQEGRRYPLIVDAYPKVLNGFKASPMRPGQGWAAKGYAVFYPAGDGPHVWEIPWKSMTNNTRAKGPKGVDVAVDDVLSGVDELIHRGIVDPDRMCLYGFSNGGAVVNQVVTKTTRFQCAVSVAAALSADWSTRFFLSPGPKFIPLMVGATPWENPQAYLELSALYRLDQVTTPMLLADGDNDGGFLLGAIEMYNGLRYLGKEVTFLRYPNQGHGFKGAAMQDFWARENAFFEKYLAPTQP